MVNIFYFSQYYAPIMDLSELDTPAKRFGYVLKCMRETKQQDFKPANPDENVGESKFTRAWLAHEIGVSQGNEQISAWEKGESLPSPV